ncbi:MAG: hypothetical protein QFF03_10375 [Pseudomonadota bacterium]|nr:hypothetical protein [Pseudomonadota bacterium]
MDGPLPLPVAELPLPVHASCHTEQAWNRAQLAQPVRTPALRLWTYRAPAVVLGCAQSSLAPLLGSASMAPVESVVRQAGGGAVLVGPWMLSVSIALPPAHALVEGSLINSYRWLGELFASLLQRRGIAAQAITPEQARTLQREATDADLGWACFGGYSPWEVVVGRQKIVGLAQVRKRTGILLVAGVLLDRPHWEWLGEVLQKPPSDIVALAARTTSCAQQSGHAWSLADIATPLGRALNDALALPPSTPGWP